mgnify:FL=1
MKKQRKNKTMKKLADLEKKYQSQQKEINNILLKLREIGSITR